MLIVIGCVRQLVKNRKISVIVFSRFNPLFLYSLECWEGVVKGF